MSDDLISLSKEIVSCKNCKRLVLFREKIANNKRNYKIIDSNRTIEINKREIINKIEKLIK